MAEGRTLLRITRCHPDLGVGQIMNISWDLFHRLPNGLKTCLCKMGIHLKIIPLGYQHGRTYGGCAHCQKVTKDPYEVKQ